MRQLAIGLVAILFALAATHTAFGQTVTPRNTSPLTSPSTNTGVGGSSSVPGAPATGFGK